MSVVKNRESKYLKFIPKVYQAHSKTTLNQLLLAFEDVFSSESNSQPVSLEKILSMIDLYFSVDKTPDEFVDWLASWVALDLRKDLFEAKPLLTSPKEQHLPLRDNELQDTTESKTKRDRRLIKELIKIYPRRGTHSAILMILEAYLGNKVENIIINDFPQPFEIGAKTQIDAMNLTLSRASSTTFGLKEITTYIQQHQHPDLTERQILDSGKIASVVGKSSIVGYRRKHYFRVFLDWQLRRVERISAMRALKKAISSVIDQEKPAHTYYTFGIKVPTIQIGVKVPENQRVEGVVGRSQVGKTTILGGYII